MTLRPDQKSLARFHVSRVRLLLNWYGRDTCSLKTIEGLGVVVVVELSLFLSVNCSHAIQGPR